MSDSTLPSENGESADHHSGKRKSLLTTRKVIKMPTSELLEGGGFADWVAEAVSALACRRRYGLARVFQLGGCLARVKPAHAGAPVRIETLDEDSLRVCIADVADFDEIRSNSKGGECHRIVPPPAEILRSVLNPVRFRERQFPALEMVASCPIFGSDGRLLVQRRLL